MELELLNEYKKAFVLKRYLQTILGGLNLKIGNSAPFYAYILQLILFLIPWLLGGCITLLLEFQILGSDSPDYVYAIVYGIIIFLFVLCTQILSLLLQKRTSQVIRLTDQNILSEEDEVEFDLCLSPHVIQYLIPVKKYKINILLHSVLSGLTCAHGLLYLAPSTLNFLYSSTPITVIFYILGWLVLSNAQYSLTLKAPPEPATFRATDVAELASLSRPFYVLVFYVIDILSRYLPVLIFLNQILHVIFITLPIFWSLGILPPLEALILWLMEQITIHGLGGSLMATNLRLVCMFVISMCSVVIGYLLPSTLPMVLFSAIAGYIFSLDLCGLANFTIERFRKQSKNTSNINGKLLIPDQDVIFVPHNSHWGLVVTHHVVNLFITNGVAMAMFYYSISFSTTVWQILGYSIIASAMLVTWLRQFQQVYIFGIFRNCLYPKDANSIDKFNQQKRRLQLIGTCHTLVMNFVMPVVMVAYVSLCISVSATSSPSFSLAVCSMRAFRWIWQSTSDSLLEISVAHFVNSVIQPSPTSSWTSMGFGLQLMVIGLSIDRLFQILHKLYTYLTILITSYTVKKQRRSSSLLLLVVSIFLFPLTFLIIITAGVLSAPLLPLFTLPIILIGFPRPLRSWPGPVGGSASVCADTIFYREMMPQLVAAFRKSLSAGSIGLPQPGYHYILRFQDRMAWIQVLERGFGFYSLSVKGMELQETSCHTVEAGELETQFQVAFENEHSRCCSLNSYLAHTMTPMDVITFATYSDAKSTLTGIIDYPETLAKIDEAFCKAFVWVLTRHVLEKKDYGSRKSTSTKTKETNGVVSPVLCDDLQTGIILPSNKGANLERVTESTGPCSSKDSGHPASSRPHSVISYELKKSSSWSSLGSFGDDGLELDRVESRKTEAKSRLSCDDLFDDLPGTVKIAHENEVDNILKELQFGMPVLDKGSPKYGSQSLNNFQQKYLGIKLASSIQFSSSHSSRLSLPFKWREIPLDQVIVQSLLDKFPSKWFRCVLVNLELGLDGKTAEEVADEMMADPALLEMYSYLTMACYLVVCGNNLSGKNGPWHVYRTYSGDLPWTPHLEWLSEDEELFSIAKQAFRLAFKLAYDQIVLGEGDEDEDILMNLEDYESRWYLGNDTDQDWKEAIEKKKPQLFSLMYNAVENTYHGRVLSHQPVVAYVGSLNQEMVRALWASLSLELLYMTNDDEERYSIQAHPIILRNLTTQSADPPLGYPIYASPPISVPTL